MCKFSEDSKQKLGNAIVFIASRVGQLSKTKLLKLLYLMEEYMVKRYHTPFLAIPYEVWQAGPVAKEHELLLPFANRECNNSDYRIDFSLALAPCAAEAYLESLDIRQTANILKA